MQVDEILAQDSRYKTSQIYTPSVKAATSMAMEKRTSRRTSFSLCSSEQFVVLLVRKAHQGKRFMGQHDETGNDSRVDALLPERPGDGETIVLSEGERALIYRRRMGFNQKQMAAISGVKRRRYGEMETRGSNTLAIVAIVEPITGAERCLILRRRSGWTQQACADLMGITRYWYNLMENGRAPSTKLEAFWNEG